MTPLVANITWFFSLGTVLLNVLAVFLLVVWWQRKADWAKPIFTFFAKQAIFGVFLLVLASVLGSLFYSDVAMFDPCKWCWWARIFMYPQLIITWMALVKKEYQHARDYVLGLSIVGLLITGYHYYLQFFAINPAPCAVAGSYQVDCAKRLFVELGYVTIPMMAFAVFAVIAILALMSRKNNTN